MKISIVKNCNTKILILFCLIICKSYNSNAQIIIGINSISANLELEQDTQFNFKIYNLSAIDTVEFWWKLIKCDAYPYDNWETFVGDQLAHYMANFDSSPMNKPNTIYPNDSTFFQIEFNANEFESNCSLCLKLYSDKNFINEIASTDCNALITVGTTSALEKTTSEILIYPNPTSDFFSIKNDEEITSVKVYDVMGRKMMDEKHYLGKPYDLSYRGKGLYKIVLTTKSNLLITNIIQHF